MPIRYRQVYRTVSKNDARAAALFNIYYSLATSAVEYRNQGNSAASRAWARDARNVITLFGKRNDGRKVHRAIEAHG